MDEYEVTENVIEFVKRGRVASVTFCDQKYIKKVKALAEKFPDDVTILDESPSHIYARLPVKFIKISWSSRTFSEEQKKALSERARQRLLKE